jgi:hypothetical protein
MKSRHPLDPVRLSVKDCAVQRSFGKDDYRVQVEVTFIYDPWLDEPGQDVVWEQANALTAIRLVLERGGVGIDT